MATTWGKPSPSIVARAAFLRSRKNAACSSGLSWISWRRLIAICDLLLSRSGDQHGASLRRPETRSDQRRRSAAAESLAQILTLGLPPLMQDGDVGAPGKGPDTHVEEVLRLICGGDLGAGRYAHLDRCFEHAALHYA